MPVQGGASWAPPFLPLKSRPHALPAGQGPQDHPRAPRFTGWTHTAHGARPATAEGHRLDQQRERCVGQGPGDESASLQVPLGQSPTAGKLVGARVSGVFTGSVTKACGIPLTELPCSFCSPLGTGPAWPKGPGTRRWAPPYPTVLARTVWPGLRSQHRRTFQELPDSSWPQDVWNTWAGTSRASQGHPLVHLHHPRGPQAL